MKFVTDPWLSLKGDNLFGPTVELPISIEEIVSNTDAFILTHKHPDHFSEYGLPKDKPIFVQNTKDEKALKKLGFTYIQILSQEGSRFGDIILFKTKGVHIKPKLFPFSVLIGDVCGVVFKHPTEKTVYFAGDTVWCSDVKNAIDLYRPDIIIVNACAAKLPVGRLNMNQEDVYRVYQAASDSIIIISHMESVSHATVTRNDMRNFLQQKSISSNIHIPNDGDVLSLD